MILIQQIKKKMMVKTMNKTEITNSRKISKKKMYSMIQPQQRTINGRLCLSFKDVLRNLIVQEIRGSTQFNTQEFTEKIKNSSTNASKSKHPMSHRHKKRLLRQSKRLQQQNIR